MSATTHRHNIRAEEAPTNTRGIQLEFRRELASRFKKLREVIRTSVGENDALGLDERIRVQAEDIEPVEEFEFERNLTKQIEFEKIVQEWIDEGILEPARQEEVREGDHYTAFYVTAAYEKGLEYADEKLLEEGVDFDPPDDHKILFTRPIHYDELETIYVRDYEALEDITSDMDRQISRILAESIRDGVGSDKAASRIYREVEDIQHKRARTLARTETLHTHNTSALNRFKQFGVQEVEILTHNPCPTCQTIEAGEPYSIEQAPLPPYHPNCVCSVVPVV